MKVLVEFDVPDGVDTRRYIYDAIKTGTRHCILEYVPLSFERLHKVNNARNMEHFEKADKGWNLADWSNAMQGEAGEAGNIVKNMRRHEVSVDHPNIKPSDGLKEKLAFELSDTVLYADILAAHAGIGQLGPWIRQKFNKISVAIGSEHLL